MVRNGIIWIASYPKSGNTWLLIFLANLMQDGRSEPVDINCLDQTPIASSHKLFDDYAGIGSADLLADEIERQRPHV